MASGFDYLGLADIGFGIALDIWGLSEPDPFDALNDKLDTLIENSRELLSNVDTVQSTQVAALLVDRESDLRNSLRYLYEAQTSSDDSAIEFATNQALALSLDVLTKLTGLANSTDSTEIDRLAIVPMLFSALTTRIRILDELQEGAVNTIDRQFLIDAVDAIRAAEDEIVEELATNVIVTATGVQTSIPDIVFVGMVLSSASDPKVTSFEYTFRLPKEGQNAETSVDFETMTGISYDLYRFWETILLGAAIGAGYELENKIHFPLNVDSSVFREYLDDIGGQLGNNLGPLRTFLLQEAGFFDVLAVLDELSVRTSGEWHQGTSGDDLIAPASTGYDTFDGFGGNDTLTGGNDHRNDVLLRGGDGDDVISGGIGDDTLRGGNGDDELTGNRGDDVLDGSDGSDRAVLTPEESFSGSLVTADLAVEGPQNTGVGGSDTFIDIEHLTAEAGNVRLFGNSFANSLVSGDGQDSLVGRGGDDTLISGNGADILSGGEGNDSVDGGAGNDSLSGGIGYDFLDGGAGGDTLSGGTGEDTLHGGTGDDLFLLDATDTTGSRDAYLGGGGKDALIIQANVTFNTLTLDAAAGIESVVDEFGAGLRGSSGDDVIDLSGVADVTGLYHFSAANLGDGNDFFIGTNQADIVEGGAGNDTMDGNGGDDIFLGGDGADVYVVRLGMGRDIIADFSAAEDNLHFENLTFIEREAMTDVTDALGYRHLTLSDGSGLTINPPDQTISGTQNDDTLSGLDGNDSLSGLDGNDNLSGGEGADIIIGGNGHDTLIGGLGPDSMVGGSGNDVYFVDDDDDVVIEGDKSGDDTIHYSGSVSFVVAADNVENLIVAPSVTYIDLFGNAIDSPIEGGGVELSFVYGEGGNDTISNAGYSFGGDGDDVLNGSDISVQLYGGSGNDRINGGDANEDISGGSGNDTMSGGGGADIFRITLRMGNDLITDFNPDEDILNYNRLAPADRAAIVDMTNAQHVRTLTLGDGSVLTIAAPNEVRSGTPDADTIRGGFGHDSLSGLAGDDLLLGLIGDDTLLGGQNDDTLEGGPGDNVLDGGQGTDTAVFAINYTDASISYDGDIVVASSVGANVLRGIENLEFLDQAVDGTALLAGFEEEARLALQQKPLSGTFNGTSIGERLDGGIGPDLLNGFGGDDTIDGGLGADLMIGGVGSDTFYVDNVADRIGESRKWAGTDTVVSSVDFRTGNRHIENVELTGEARIGAGNGLRTVITGNDQDNILDGGKNVDTLIGGAGDDIYLLRAPGDIAVETADGGIDTVRSFGSFTLGDNVEKLFMQTSRAKDGSAVHFNGIGNALDNTIIGTPFDNTIVGREGSDTLKGQAGSDTFVFDRPIGPNNVDRIVDFNTNEANEGDILQLKGSEFGGLAAGTLSESAFVLDTMAIDADNRMVFDQAAGQLWFDADGSGAGARILIANFDQNATVTAADIEVF